MDTKTTNQPKIKIEKGTDGQLVIRQNGTAIAVRVFSCFPWSYPNRFISLRDKDENEIALIDDLNHLDDASRKLVEAALAETGFILRIQKIEFMEEDYEIRTWKVQTEQGIRSFQTKLDEWPRTLPDGGLLIKDVAGDLFLIQDPHGLDEHSRHLLWSFLG